MPFRRTLFLPYLVLPVQFLHLVSLEVVAAGGDPVIRFSGFFPDAGSLLGFLAQKVIAIGIPWAIIPLAVVAFRQDLPEHTAVFVVKPALGSSVCVVDADTVSIPVVLIPGSFPLCAILLEADWMDLAGDLPVKVPEYPLMLLLRGNGICQAL